MDLPAPGSPGADLVEHAAIGEVGLLGCGPAAEGVVDGEELYRCKLLGVFGGDFGVTRAVVVFAGEGLAFGGVQVFEIGGGDFAGAAFVDDLVDNADRRFGKDGDRRRDQIELVGAEFLERQIGFVFPGDQHVANAALDKGGGRAAGAGIQHLDVGEQLFDEIPGAGLGAARLLERVTPCREVVPAGAAGGLGVGGDDGDAGFDQVVPVMDFFGVALAHQEHDG